MVKKKYRDRRRQRKKPWYEQMRQENPVKHHPQWEQIYKKVEAEEWAKETNDGSETSQTSAG